MNVPTPIQVHQLGNIPQHTPNFPITMPAGNENWSVIFNRFPRRGVFSQAFLARLEQSEELRNPHYLTGGMNPQQVNGFLNALNTTFPRLGTGPRTVQREVAATTLQGLQAAFGNQAAGFYYTGSAVGQHASGAAGTLALVATGPHVVWSNSYTAQGFITALEVATAAFGPDSPEVAQLRTDRDAARAKHESGSADWHDVVTYIYQRKTFIYDPSAISCNSNTAGGRAVLEQLETNDIPAGGLQGNALVGVNGARALWAHGFNNPGSQNQGRLGRRNTTRGVWIGGGGNVQQLVVQNVFNTGECRAMCGDFIFMAHVLQWLADRGSEVGLSAQQRSNALFNLDWLLGGYLDGTSTVSAMQNSRRLHWVRVRLQ